MNDLDRETRDAVDALASRLGDRGEASDEWLAAEFMAWLKARGWRPVLALPAAADWRRRGGGNGAPDPSGQGGADYLAAKAAITGRMVTGEVIPDRVAIEAAAEGGDDP